jgi:hypothetical protein
VFERDRERQRERGRGRRLYLPETSSARRSCWRPSSHCGSSQDLLHIFGIFSLWLPLLTSSPSLLTVASLSGSSPPPHRSHSPQRQHQTFPKIGNHIPTIFGILMLLLLLLWSMLWSLSSMISEKVCRASPSLFHGLEGETRPLSLSSSSPVISTQHRADQFHFAND